MTKTTFEHLNVKEKKKKEEEMGATGIRTATYGFKKTRKL
jgi:hypothetical protein